MSKLKSGLFSLKAFGRIGDITLRRNLRRVIAEKVPALVDAGSPAQLSWRPMFLLAKELWHALSVVEKREWERTARPHHLTGYQWFMSQALRPNPGLYLPLLGGTMQGAINMGVNSIVGLPSPTGTGHATRKSYVDGKFLADIHGPARHTDITREIFLPAGEAWIASGTLINKGIFSVVRGAADLAQPALKWSLKVPVDFVSFVKVEAVWIVATGHPGNMFWLLDASWSAHGEAYNTHTEVYGASVTATIGNNLWNVQESANTLILANLASGDYLGLGFTREGGFPQDTLDVDVDLLGLLFTYVADQ